MKTNYTKEEIEKFKNGLNKLSRFSKETDFPVEINKEKLNKIIAFTTIDFDSYTKLSLKRRISLYFKIIFKTDLISISLTDECKNKINYYNDGESIDFEIGG